MPNRLLREPFLHFLVLGAALFVLNAVADPDSAERPRHIVVDARQSDRLAEQFQRTRNRSPTAREMDALVDGYVMEEILYREALALGLDRNDAVIRRRLRQKMERLNADRAEPREPTDSDLETFMEARPEMFRSPGRVSFHHIFLNTDAPAGAAAERAARMRERLNDGPDAAIAAGEAGDPTPLPRHLNAATLTAVRRLFGDPFAQALADAPVGRWIGPMESAHGVHLIQVSDREPGRLPALEDVRAAVEREWSAARRAEADERLRDALRSRYTVEIEKASETSSGKPAP